MNYKFTTNELNPGYKCQQMISVHCQAAVQTFPIHTDYTTPILTVHVHSTVNVNRTQSDKKHNVLYYCSALYCKVT